MSLLVKYLLCWFLLAVTAIANGVVREGTYGRSLSELAAHQISTVTGILMTAAVVWGFSRLWPLGSSSQAWTVGILWLILTITFEFGFGHYVAGHAWSKLIADYNLLNGRIWLLFLVWIGVMPYVIYRIG